MHVWTSRKKRKDGREIRVTATDGINTVHVSWDQPDYGIDMFGKPVTDSIGMDEETARLLYQCLGEALEFIDETDTEVVGELIDGVVVRLQNEINDSKEKGQ